MNDLLSLDRKNIWHPFTPLQSDTDVPMITRGEGVYLHTEDGRRLIDGISSWWVNLHGHANETIASAIADQARKLEHVIFAGFTHAPAVELSRNLLSSLPPSYKRVFFSDNGSTAVEVALKMAIQYWHNLGIQRKKVIAMKGAYHGDTFGAMSVAERGMFTEPFFPYLFETEFIEFPSADQEKKTVDQFRELLKTGDVAAFIFEPLVQAAAGMRMYSASVLDQLLRCAEEAGVICIADEVFTGFGRTGKNFAIDYLHHKPDIITLSKGITGGFLPLGVTICSHKIEKAFDTASFDRTFFHGHSYTANPLACAAANASFDLLMDPSCQERINKIGELHAAFARSLAARNNILDVRTLGTILAIEIKTMGESGYANALRKSVRPFFIERNILLRPLGNVIYILPPYVITQDQLNIIYRAVEEFLDAVA